MSTSYELVAYSICRSALKNYFVLFQEKHETNIMFGTNGVGDETVFGKKPDTLMCAVVRVRILQISELHVQIMPVHNFTFIAFSYLLPIPSGRSRRWDGGSARSKRIRSG